MKVEACGILTQPHPFTNAYSGEVLVLKTTSTILGWSGPFDVFDEPYQGIELG